MNARFWIYWNGNVKITLAPGETITLSGGGRTDEGYQFHSETYSFDGYEIECSLERHGRDCDGPFESQSVCTTTMEQLTSVQGICDPTIYYPQWERANYRQRDTYAEMMGY